MNIKKSFRKASMVTELNLRVKGVTLVDAVCFVIEVDQLPRTVLDYHRILEELAAAVEYDDEAKGLSFVIDTPFGMKQPVTVRKDKVPTLELLDVALPWVVLKPEGD